MDALVRDLAMNTVQLQSILSCSNHIIFLVVNIKITFGHGMDQKERLQQNSANQNSPLIEVAVTWSKIECS